LAWEIIQREHLLVVCHRREAVLDALTKSPEHYFWPESACSLLKSRLHLFELPSNDTWARDHGPLSVYIGGEPYLYDFTFNGWGQKYASEKDDKLTRLLFHKGAFDPSVRLQSFPFVLEGGSIECNGEGVLLTTASCLMESHRNPGMSREEIDEWLKSYLGLKQIHWLNEGYLAGDDTDGHIDMLVRFCNQDTIAYVAPPDVEDEHAPVLQRMEEDIKCWTNLSGAPYQ
jgi:agmatine/peptidylarginine deiminase